MNDSPSTARDGHESILEPNMRAHASEINRLAPVSRMPFLRAARALEAAAQRRRMERRAQG